MATDFPERVHVFEPVPTSLPGSSSTWHGDAHADLADTVEAVQGRLLAVGAETRPVARGGTGVSELPRGRILHGSADGKQLRGLTTGEALGAIGFRVGEGAFSWTGGVNSQFMDIFFADGEQVAGVWFDTIHPDIPIVVRQVGYSNPPTHYVAANGGRRYVAQRRDGQAWTGVIAFNYLARVFPRQLT